MQRVAVSSIHGGTEHQRNCFPRSGPISFRSAANDLQYHDDGEKDLGPDIVSMSLGGAATMNFRIKEKHWQASGLTCQNYDPEQEVLPGSQAWKMRVAVNDLYKAGETERYERAKEELVEFLNKQKKKNGPVVLSLELRHGDMVVMHGEEIQRIYEVCIPLPLPLPMTWLIPFSTVSSQRENCDMG